MPGRIEELESEIAALHEAMAQPEFYAQPGDNIAAEQSRLKRLDEQLASAYERWEDLERHA